MFNIRKNNNMCEKLTIDWNIFHVYTEIFSVIIISRIIFKFLFIYVKNSEFIRTTS